MDSPTGPRLPFGPFEKPGEGPFGKKKDPNSEALHQCAHAFFIDLMQGRSCHKKILQQLGVIMFVAEAGVLPKDMAEKTHLFLERMRESFFYSSMKEEEMVEELQHIIHQIKASKPEAKIIAIIEELFCLLVKNPAQGIPALTLQQFEELMAPIEEKVFSPLSSRLHISHIASRLERIKNDIQSHPKELGSHCLYLLEQLVKEVRDIF